MGILNRPNDGQVTVLLALSRTLRAYGPVSEDRLKALCAPKSLVGDDKSSSQIHKTLLRWKQLGLFVEEAAGENLVLRLAPPFDAPEFDDFEKLRAPLRSLVLAIANNPLEAREAGEGDASDFSLAAAWLLQQDPYQFPHNWSAVEGLQSEQSVAPAFLSNSDRWQGLAEWVPFLGLGRVEKHGLIPNPAHAVRAVLSDAFGSSSLLLMEDFLAAVAALVPVLDRGLYWREAAQRVGTPALLLGTSDVSLCLSLALLQLDRERCISFERRSDAAVFRLLGRGGRELRQITHVSRLEARS